MKNLFRGMCARGVGTGCGWMVIVACTLSRGTFGGDSGGVCLVFQG